MHHPTTLNCAAFTGVRYEISKKFKNLFKIGSNLLKMNISATIIVLAIALSTDALEDTEIPVSYSVIFP